MIIKEWFDNNVYQPVSKLYHYYILRETKQQNDIQNTVSDIYDVNDSSSLTDQVMDTIPITDDNII